MTAFPKYINIKHTGFGHEFPAPANDGAFFVSGPKVQAKDAGNPVFSQNTRSAYFPGAARCFLRRLKYEQHIARQGVRGFRQFFGKAEHYRGMPVMAAGVHPARMGRRVIAAVPLGYGQGVHIAAKSNRIRRARVEIRAQAGAPRGYEFAGEPGKRRRHISACFGQIETQFGYAVQLSAVFRQSVLHNDICLSACLSIFRPGRLHSMYKNMLALLYLPVNEFFAFYEILLCKRVQD
jgi:hypothetical protein